MQKKNFDIKLCIFKRSHTSISNSEFSFSKILLLLSAAEGYCPEFVAFEAERRVLGTPSLIRTVEAA